MKLLEERIQQDGKVLPGDILKVDSFINHQIDTKLMDEIGKEFARLFADKGINKILTIEASGIAIAMAASRYLGFVPVVFAKKTAASNMGNETYASMERSYTRGVDYEVKVSRDYLNENDRVLILDDFLANGEAMSALIRICDQAKAEVVGVGAIICKTYQPGEQRIRDLGYDVKVLARVSSLGEDGSITFEE